MKILIIEQHDKERSVIREAVQAGRHEAVWARNADEALTLITAGEEIRFVIADADASDVIASGLIRRVQAMDISPVYFLMLTSRLELPAGADDFLHKPFTAIELQTRL